MPDSHLNHLSIEQLRDVNAICQDFERSLRSGKTLRLKDVVDDAPAGLQNALQHELSVIEREWRQQARQPPSLPTTSLAVTRSTSR